MFNTKENNPGLFRILFHDFFSNVAACFRLKMLPMHLLAIALTWILVYSGFDSIYYVNAQNSNLIFFFFPALILGGLLPIIIPLILYFYGKSKRNWNMVKIAGAIGQAALIGLLLSFFYKSFTGRMQPDLIAFGSNVFNDISNGFRFGFLRGGVFWGWPSSHTTVSFAISTALITLFPKNRTVKILALLYAFYVGIGVATVGIHWFSDFVAGIIFGSIVGFIVGKSYYNNKSLNPVI